MGCDCRPGRGDRPKGVGPPCHEWESYFNDYSSKKSESIMIRYMKSYSTGALEGLLIVVRNHQSDLQTPVAHPSPRANLPDNL